MRYFSSSNPSSSLQSVMISAQMSRLLCPARIIYTPPGCFQSTSGVSTPFSYMDSFSSRYLSGWLSFKSGYRFHSAGAPSIFDMSMYSIFFLPSSSHSVPDPAFSSALDTFCAAPLDVAVRPFKND